MTFQQAIADGQYHPDEEQVFLRLAENLGIRLTYSAETEKAIARAPQLAKYASGELPARNDHDPSAAGGRDLPMVGAGARPRDADRHSPGSVRWCLDVISGHEGRLSAVGNDARRESVDGRADP